MTERRCIDCRWCKWPYFATGDRAVIEITAACFHPRAEASASVVTGTGASRPCAIMRQPLETGGAVCGPIGLLWEATSKAVTP